MAIKTIAELTAISTLADSHVFVIDDGEHNYKISWGALKALTKAVASFAADPDQTAYPGRLKLTLADGTVLRAYAADPAKQDLLTWDDAPTANSNNPVKSGGIKSALDDKLDADDYVQFTGASGVTAGTAGIVPAPQAAGKYLSSDGVWESPDTQPVADSGKLITSGAVKAAIDGIEIAVDDELDPTSENPVQNKVLVTELDKKADEDDLTAGTLAHSDLHLGFYIGEDGGLCQADE